MNYIVRVERAANHPIAVVQRRVSPYELSRVIPEACGLVWKVVQDAAVKDAGRLVAVYRDSGDSLLNIEVGVEVSTPFLGHGEVIGSVTPAGNVASVTHFGPYGRLGEAHQAIRHWCAAQDHVLAGVHWEIYGHWLDEWNNDPSKIRTDIFYLLSSQH